MKGRLERDEQKGRLEGKICQSQISLRMEPDGDGDAEGGGSSGFKKLYSGNDCRGLSEAFADRCEFQERIS